MVWKLYLNKAVEGSMQAGRKANHPEKLLSLTFLQKPTAMSLMVVALPSLSKSPCFAHDKSVQNWYTDFL